MELTNRIDRYSDVLCKAIIATVMIVVILFCVSGITNAVTRKVDLFNSFNTSDVTSDVRTKQLDCLTKNIYWEAASEPFEGKVAVAQVTLNRTNHASFPSDICGVVYQKTAIQNKIVCQFSWFCERTYLVKPVHRREYEEAAAVARKVLLENFRIESVQDAIYYHADYVNPSWRKERVAKIGRHIFYKG
jgi:spore germination cell wall hydrolase CwlJ-like protein